MAFPFPAPISETVEDPYLGHVMSWKSAMLEHRCLLRALARPRIPTKLDTSDLTSPYDGKPLTYSSDGKQIRIEISAGLGSPRVIEFPLPRR
jgi:hypothetical protein